MKGLFLSEEYYKKYGQPMIREYFSDYEDRIAVGLVGEGSECLGYDDELSADHDFGPGFCLWLTDADYSAIGATLQIFYNQLPQSFLGYRRIPTSHAGQRIGVMRITDFYRKYVGNVENFSQPLYWLRVPEYLIVTATNGKIFHDPLGEFTRIRNRLLEYYPEDIRIKKIASQIAMMAQTGQYNYSRAIKRKEDVTARLSLDIFIKETISLFFLLNKTYMPYYKWAFRRLQELPVLKDTVPLIRELAAVPAADESTSVRLIEEICAAVVEELLRQNLTATHDDFLDHHINQVTNHIKDPAVKNLPLLLG